MYIVTVLFTVIKYYIFQAAVLPTFHLFFVSDNLLISMSLKLNFAFFKTSYFILFSSSPLEFNKCIILSVKEALLTDNTMTFIANPSDV